MLRTGPIVTNRCALRWSNYDLGSCRSLTLRSARPNLEPPSDTYHIPWDCGFRGRIKTNQLPHRILFSRCTLSETISSNGSIYFDSAPK